MDEIFPFLIFIVFAGIIIAVFVLQYLAAQKRREELFLLATRMGFEFYPGDPFSIPLTYAQFEFIARGHRRRAYNIMRGRMGGFDVTAFDYEYYVTQSTGKSSREVRHTYSAVIVDTPVAFQPLIIRPEGMFDRIKGALGFDDIDFESDEFSRAFYVSSPDKKFAYDVIHQRMMEFLLAHRRWHIQILGRSILLHSSSVLTPAGFSEAIDMSQEFLRHFPQYLWEQLGLNGRLPNG